MRYLAPEEVVTLIEEARQCDREAFGRLWERYKDAVRGFIRPRVEQDADADDVLEHTAEEVWRRKSEYDPRKGAVYTWLRSWAKIQLKDYYKARRKWKELHILESELQEHHDREAQEDILYSTRQPGLSASR